jgi:hypothetical protein
MRVLWRIFARYRDEVTGGSRNVHNEELQVAYSSSDNKLLEPSNQGELDGHGMYKAWVKSSAYNILAEKLE